MAITDLSKIHNNTQGESTFHYEGTTFLLRLEPLTPALLTSQHLAKQV